MHALALVPSWRQIANPKINNAGCQQSISKSPRQDHCCWYGGKNTSASTFEDCSMLSRDVPISTNNILQPARACPASTCANPLPQHRHAQEMHRNPPQSSSNENTWYSATAVSQNGISTSSAAAAAVTGPVAFNAKSGITQLPRGLMVLPVRKSKH